MRAQGQPALQSLECASGSWDIVSIGDSYQVTEFGAMGATAIYGYKHLFTFLRRRRGVGAWFFTVTCQENESVRGCKP
jgi:hypothetical protein